MNAKAQQSPHEIGRQSEAKLKQVPQSEANVCRQRTKKPPLLIAQNTQHRSRASNAIKDGDIHLFLFQATPQLDYCFMCSLSSISKLLARNLVDFRLDFPSRSPATRRMDYFLSKLWNDIRGGIDRRSFKGEFK